MKVNAPVDRYRKGYGPWGRLWGGEKQMWHDRDGDKFWTVYTANPPARDWYNHVLMGLGEYSSVCEIGAAAGMNLLLLEKSRPGVTNLVGVDLNRYIVERSRKELLVDAKTELIIQDGLEFLEQQPDSKFDVVLIAGVLLSLSEPEVRQIVRQCVRVAAKRIVLIERHKFGALSSAMGNYAAHDYWTLFGDVGIGIDRVSVSQFPPSLLPSDASANAAIVVDVS